MRLIALLAFLILGACAMPPPEGRAAGGATVATDPMAAIARDYVRLQLAIGEKEEGYIDAYYGPEELRAEARAHAAAAGHADLAREVAALRGRLAAVSAPAGSMEARRIAFLLAQLTAADTRLRMMQGERLSFVEEAEGLFGVRPELRPLSAYDPVLARIETVVPGTGPLADRVDAFQGRYTIPADRLQNVFDAAIAECRRRTVAHIPLPEEERFTLEFVTGKSWSGYNWYQGDYRSLIQINTDLPVRIARAVDLGCHEGYPGHHVYNMLLERELARGRGWIEYMVYPLYSPQSLIAEGTANYGIDLAFPGPERLAFEAGMLYPLAGLDPAGAGAYLQLLDALRDLGGARFTIAADYLDGRIDREQAVALTQRYQLVSRARAEQSIAFTDQYRSYVINYGLGRDMTAAYVEAAGPDPATRWARMRRLLSEPVLPSDLIVR
jgi:hypothetical protein